MTSRNVPEELLAQMNSFNPGAAESGVHLPFPSPLIWWTNGKKQLAALQSAAPVSYFGGWRGKKEAIDETCALDQRAAMPWQVVQATPGLGDAYTAYDSRTVFAARIATRVFWYVEELKRSFTKFPEGMKAQKRVHTVALVGFPDETGAIVPWGPAVLSAKGFQVGYLEKAFGDWDTLTRAVRTKEFSGQPSWAFYAEVGTVGKYQEELKGQVGRQSPITPIQLVAPAEIDGALLEKRWVTTDLIAQIIAWNNESADWLHAFDNTSVAAAGDATETYVGDDDGAF